jgi:DNA-binding response OmpR family regulator
MNKKGRILIVDDNPKNIQVLANILNDNNYDVEIALGGKETIEWLKEETFDLLLLDIMMPEINGFEVCKIIRKNPKYDLLPIIYLTAKTDKESLIHGFEVGGQDYITKPFDTHELLARVKTHIELKQSKENLIKTNTHLEEKVAERTLALENTNKELKVMARLKNNFLSFIGKEITYPLHSLEKAIHHLKHAAESKKFSKTIVAIESSVSRLDLITRMAHQITKIKNGESLSTQPFNINNLLEHILLQFDETLDVKNINLNCDFSKAYELYGNKELIKNTIIGILETILNHVCNSETININTTSKDSVFKLSIETKMDKWQTKEIHNLPVETSLFFSYAKLVMEFHNKQFLIEQRENNIYTFTWLF